MRSSTPEHKPCRHRHDAVARHGRWPRWVRVWISGWTVVAGLFALLWLLLRSGTKPSRLAYPCQQAAAGTAVLAFGVPLVATIVAGRQYLMAGLRRPVGRVVAGLLIACGLSLWAVASLNFETSVDILTPPVDYHPDVFLVNDAGYVSPTRFLGVDKLLAVMGENGYLWHRSATTGPTAGPSGLIPVDGVVLLKVNGQWAERGGTNTDVLRGVIRQIVEHPDGFIGEVIVADNGQGSGSLDRFQSNAEDRTQSMQDVVDDFVTEGWTVSTRLWDVMRRSEVSEYSDGNVDSMYDGYIRSPILDPETETKVTYPKFQSAGGAYVSFKYGVWSPTAETYDRDQLVIINMPVLKTHFWYAVTESVKHYMGVISQGLEPDTHYDVARGGMGTVMAEVGTPDLTILDCIWILARPGMGPGAIYADASRRDQLVASTDPVALDAWAAKFILMPQIIENGYTYAQYHNTQDPDNPSSTFRTYLDLSMNELLSAGIDTTNDYTAVTLHEWVGPPVPLYDDLPLFILCMDGPGRIPPTQCLEFDTNADDYVDLLDVSLLISTPPGLD